MSLKGDIQTMSIPDHLQWAHAARKTGVTVFQKRELIKELVFENGVLIWVNSNDPREHLGQIALQRNLLDQKKLHDVLELHKKSGVTLGQLLVEMQEVARLPCQLLLLRCAVQCRCVLQLREVPQFLLQKDVGRPSYGAR